MNHVENPIDSAVTRELRDALSELATPERPALAAITSRGRAHQRRRLAGFTGLGVTGAAAATALALALTGALSVSPAQSGERYPRPSPRQHWHESRRHHPDRGLHPHQQCQRHRHADADHESGAQRRHPPAGTHGTRHPGPGKDPHLLLVQPSGTRPCQCRVLSVQPPAGAPHSNVPAPSLPSASEMKQIAARTVTVINPAALRSGTELFFGYSTTANAVFTDLIYTASYTCSNNP